MANDTETPLLLPFSFSFRCTGAKSSRVTVSTSVGDAFSAPKALSPSPSDPTLFVAAPSLLPAGKEIRVRFTVDGVRVLSEDLGRVKEKASDEDENVLFLDPQTNSPASTPGSPLHSTRTRYDRYDDFVILDSNPPILHFDSDDEDDGSEASWEDLEGGAGSLVFESSAPVPVPPAIKVVAKEEPSSSLDARFGSSGRTFVETPKPAWKMDEMEKEVQKIEDENTFDDSGLEMAGALPRWGKGYLDDGPVFDET